MKRRRYREKRGSISVASTHGEGRIHDFLRGWGTCCKDGSILWDCWRPITKRESERILKRQRKATQDILDGNVKLIINMVNATFPALLASDIVSVQPMNAPLKNFI